MNLRNSSGAPQEHPKWLGGALGVSETARGISRASERARGSLGIIQNDSGCLRSV